LLFEFAGDFFPAAFHGERVHVILPCIYE
jgi:hypothetical protein